MADEPMSQDAIIRNIAMRLAEHYGVPRWSSHGPPLDALVATILSQHTSDTNSGRAFAELRSCFPTWQAVADAEISDISAAILTGGLANLKAPRIQRVLHAIFAEFGEYSLDRLQSWYMEDARSWLLNLPGVGPKTAACVLLFSLGMPAMPVDTHVHRVGRRLGVLPADGDAGQAHLMFDRLMGSNRDEIYALHLNLIRHGRTICKARIPLCGACVLNDLCPSAVREPETRCP